MPRVRSTSPFVSKTAYEAGIALGRTDAETNTDAALQRTQDYFTRALSRPKTRDVLRRGMCISEHFFKHAPRSDAADIARRSLFAALGQLYPAFEAARHAVEQADGLGCMVGIVVGGARAMAEQWRLLDDALLENVEAQAEAVRALWPRMCIVERAAMRLARYADADVIQSYRAFCTFNQSAYQAGVARACAQVAEVMRADAHVLQSPPLTAEETARLADLDAIQALTHQPLLEDTFAAHVRQPLGAQNRAKAWPAFCRIYLVAARGQDLRALRTLLETPTGERLCDISQKTQEADQADRVALALRAPDERQNLAADRVFQALSAQLDETWARIDAAAQHNALTQPQS